MRPAGTDWAGLDALGVGRRGGSPGPRPGLRSMQARPGAVETAGSSEGPNTYGGTGTRGQRARNVSTMSRQLHSGPELQGAHQLVECKNYSSITSSANEVVA